MPRIEHDDPIAERHGLDLVVRDIDRRRAELAVDHRDLATHLQSELGIEIRQRFVEQKDLRLAHDRPSNRHALALSA